MPFTGFSKSLPVFEVVTPQTKQSFIMKAMTVRDEEELKGSYFATEKIIEHINKCIFKCIQQGPKDIVDFDSFMKNTTVKDRDALLYGIYHVTYKEIKDYSITCPYCQNVHYKSIKTTDITSVNPYPGKDVLSDRINCLLEDRDNVVVVLKQPTLDDERSNLMHLASRPGAILETVNEICIIESIMEITKTGKSNENDEEGVKVHNKWTDREDIYDAYCEITSFDKNLINQRYVDNFGKYQISMNFKTKCPKCGNEDNINIDLLEALFRAMYSTQY